MFDGFPVPDFNFDDNPDVSPFEVIPTGAHALTPAEITEFESHLNITICCDSPLRCTGNSAVYLAESNNDQSFAVKITPHKRRVADEYAKRLLLPDSPYLVKTISFYETTNKALLQMELCANGDISSFQFLYNEDILQLIFDVGSALKCLHDAGWMHLDVSPGNILVGDEFFKLADFGTLTRIGEFVEGCEGAGPYVSPEALAFPGGQFDVGPPTDIFSFGVVLLEVASGVMAPRGGCDGYVKLRRGMLKLGEGNFVSQFDTEIQNLINLMLDPDPRKRPTAAELVEAASR